MTNMEKDQNRIRRAEKPIDNQTQAYRKNGQAGKKKESLQYDTKTILWTSEEDIAVKTVTENTFISQRKK